MTLLLAASARLDAAIARAQDFLLSAQDANGGWRDFLLPAGLSDGWVTGYVGEALIEGEGPDRPWPAARRAWRFLQSAETPLGGWSYNANVPGDADSTLWGLRFAEAIDEATMPVAERAYAFLDRHIRKDGGLSTYAEAGPIRDYTGMPAFVPFDGWVRSHVCVSAAGANLSRRPAGLIDYLVSQQDEDGGWSGYFWFDREYATGEAVRALSRIGPDDSRSRDAIDLAATWLTRRVLHLAAAEGRVRPTFALACAARALADVARNRDAREALARAADSLVEWQRETGSWGPSARLRVPPPYAIVPPEEATWTRWEGLPPDTSSSAEVLAATFTNFSPDHRGLFSAATALRALRAIARGKVS
ncbi:prenyltransferase/squalene oxidase repeat-containing protein [Sphingomonas sp. HF-S3]|uniref:Prenyltransferase/squalene oxidase repeat-containing protein n=1 Tax=Sphingomonas rustica TaxID=3103142 RepID=A0ABV0B5X5_9SPHN